MASIKQKQIGEIVLTTGSTVNIDSGDVSAAPFSVADNAILYRVTGTQTLSVGNFVITITGSAGPTKNTQVVILWEAVCTPSTNDVIIAGTTIPDEMVGSNFIATCTYNGSAWQVNVDPSMDGTGLIAAKLLASDSVTTAKILDLNVTTAKIADLGVTTGKLAAGAVTTAKIAAGAVTTTEIAANTIVAGNIVAGTLTATELANLTITAAKIANGTITTTQIAAATIVASNLAANANKYTRDITLSFQQASEVGNVNFTIWEDCTIDEINVTVLDPAVTDTATLIYKDNGGTVLTGSQTDITTGLTIGNIVSTTPTANNVFSSGDNLLIEMSKTTKTSCKVNVALFITKK
jgi:hypothetical protein